MNPRAPVVGWYTSQQADVEILLFRRTYLNFQILLNFANTPATPRRWWARLRTFYHPLCSISSPRVTARALITVEESKSSGHSQRCNLRTQKSDFEGPCSGFETQLKSFSAPSKLSSPPAKPYLSNSPLIRPSSTASLWRTFIAPKSPSSFLATRSPLSRAVKGPAS